jgi:hypothetical protein
MGKTRYNQKENKNCQKENKGKLKRNNVPNIKNQCIVIKEDIIKNPDLIDFKKEIPKENSIQNLKQLFFLLLLYFYPNEKVSQIAIKQITKKFSNIETNNLLNDYQNLYSVNQFYHCFLLKIRSLLYKKVNEKKAYYCIAYSNFLKVLYKEKLEDYLFNDKKVSSFIRQDLILNYFDDVEKFVNLIQIILIDNIWYYKIDPNKLLRNEGINSFKDNFLYSNVLLSNIQTTLENVENDYFEINQIQNSIEFLLPKINFYCCPLPEQFASFNCLGNNIIIRNYFYLFKNVDDIKIPLKIILSKELIKELIIQYENSYFPIFNNDKLLIAENQFETLLLGGKINYYSWELLNYLNDISQYSKCPEVFAKIINSINLKYQKSEKYIEKMSDLECIKENICRIIRTGIKIENKTNSFNMILI